MSRFQSSGRPRNAEAVAVAPDEADPCGPATGKAEGVVVSPGEADPVDPGASAPSEVDPGASAPGAAHPGTSAPGEVDPGASGPGEAAAASSGDPLGLDSGSSSSWGNSADVEIQRGLIARRVFDGAPFTIDRFEVEKLVGAGASAAVYAARDPKLDRRVAIKVLARAREARVGAATDRWIREARAQADLPHRNVVPIYEVGQWNDRPFIVMELIEGTTLARWLAAQRRSVAEILMVFREAGLGLAAAHARGHVHRDFKPANVLVAHDGRVMVSDFGLVDDVAQGAELAGEAGAGATTGAIGSAGGNAPRRAPVGTPAYVAPEQRAGAAAHPSADVYSFALALVEAVLGDHPTPESSERWKAALRRCVPHRLYRELCAALVPQPEQRAQSLGSLLAAISMHGAVRRRLFARALAVGGVVMLVAAALWWSRGGRAPTDLAPSPPQSLRPAAMSLEVRALLGTPPEWRDDSWRARARTVLMLPIPMQVPCLWLAPPLAAHFVGDQVVAVDAQGRVMSCAISTGIVSVVAGDVTCLQPVDDTMFGVTFRDHRISVYQHRGSGWRPVPLDGPTVDTRPGGGHGGYCPFYVSTQGIVPPRIILVGQPASSQQDNHVAAGGGRKISYKADLSLWVQVGDAPPALLVPPRRVVGARFDEMLHYGVLATSAHVQIYDVISSRVVAEAPVPVAPPSSLTFDISRDGSVAVARGIDGVLLWWRRGERQWRSQLITMEKPLASRLSPRGQRVLMWNSVGRLDVLEPVSGRRYPLADAQIQRAEFLDDDQVVAVDESGAVWQWSLAHQRSWVLADHAGAAKEGMWGFAICDHGSSVITATNRTDRAILMSSPSGAAQVVLTKPPGAQIYGLACRGDQILAGTRDGHLLAWERPTGRALADEDLGVRAWVWTIATAQPADGPGTVLIGTGQTRDPGNYLGGRVMALRNGALTTIFTAHFGGNTGIGDIAVSADGRMAAAVASSGELALIDVGHATASPTVLAHIDGEARRVRFAEGERSVVTAGDDGYLQTWDIVDGALTPHSKIQLGHGRIFALDLHGTAALVGTSDGHIGTWNLTTGSLIHAYRGHSSWVATTRFDPSGRWIASGDYDGRVCLHRVDLEDCYATLIGHKQDAVIRHVKFLDDGQLITVSEDGTVRQWNPLYEASISELACELQGYLFDPGHDGVDVMARECAARAAVRPHRVP
jgi:serine/threonine protein kinase/WD40 repeat protein